MKYVQPIILIVICGLVALMWAYSRSFSASLLAADENKMRRRLIANTRILDCPKDAILCGVKFISDSEKSPDFRVSRDLFHSLMTSIDFQCPSTKRFGREGDGGYEACMSPATRPRTNACLVYSFGISGDWSFDEDMAKYGCEVHSFDPSIGKQDHMHAPNISFHNLGLWGSDITNSNGWKLERLSTIRKRLGHEERVIDVLKVDVEGAEWPFLRDVIYSTDGSTSPLSHVRQLFLELHAPRFRPHNLTASDLAEINVYVTQLRHELGFQLYKNVQRNNCCARFCDIMPPGVPERCCHEVFLFNSHLLRR